MKQFVTIIVSFLLSIAAIPAASAQSGGGYFSDVPENAWYAQSVDICYESGLVNGIGNNRFNPNGTMTIAEMLTVCTRLHNVLNGGDGNIPQLPSGGLDEVFYFTDNDGSRIASFQDVERYSSLLEYYFNREFFVYFDEDAMSRLSNDLGLPSEIILVSMIDEEKQFGGTYEIDQSGAAGYRIDFPGMGGGLPNDMSMLYTIDTYISEYPNAWIASTMWYLDSTVLANLDDKMIAPAIELAALIETDYPEVDADGFSGDGIMRECPRAVLALYLALCIPREYLQQINDISAVQGLDTEITRILYGAGIMGGVDKQGSFDGHGTLTRAQMATVVSRIIVPELRLELSF